MPKKEFIKRLNTDHLSDDEYKKYRYQEIDNRTGELIQLGYDYAGMTFSFSENAQNNLLGAFAARNSLTYPVEWNNIDDTNSYNIADAAEMESFFLVALSSKKTHQDSGTNIKGQIRAAANRGAMESIFDNR